MPFIHGIRRNRGDVTIPEAANPETLVGRLHLALKSIRFVEAEPPRPPEPAKVATGWASLKEQALKQERPTAFDETVIRIAHYVTEAVPSLPDLFWDNQPRQVCHRDPHLDNLLFNPAGHVIALLDFDNAAPWWTGVELMTAWNLSVCADPARPSLTPEGAAFFAAYREAVALSVNGSFRQAGIP